jgi:1,2-diacylglycerol 3-beta-glucosyltransferase
VGVSAAGTWLVAGAGAAASSASIYLLTLAVAAFAHRTPEPGPSGRNRLIVLVPAYNEEELLRRCLDSLRHQSYPADLYRIVVIADNCTDGTATVARLAGAEVLVRDDPSARGKGRALRWAMDALLAEPNPADALVVVDADSIAHPEMLRALEARMAAGADVVQGEYLVLHEPGTGSELREAAFLLFHRTRFAGREALGMSCSLVGNGMLFRRSVLEAHPWNAYIGAEDLEYTITLRLAGVKPRFAAAARVSGPSPGFGRPAAIQRMRWEGGRFQMVRTRLAGLVVAAFRSRDWSLLDAAADLAVPPLGLLVLITGAGGSLAAAGWAAHLTASWAVLPWAIAATGIVGYVVIGLRAARAPSSMYRALLAAPRFLLAKAGTYLRMTRGLRSDTWVRTERPGERPVTGRVDVCGVPIDVVDQAQAAERIMSAVTNRTFLQVATVNLQFLVTARRRPAVRRALNESGLNVADGAPVVWLARVLGRRLPGRIAGADLVPALLPLAAASGARVFLLGAGEGVAREAADVLTRRHPGLVVSGTLCPPRTSLEEMDNEAIIAEIARAGADILLVALGHPKQDLWIAGTRDALPVSVAIGVGGTLDLIAGRVGRAPRSLQRIGLEWLYRLAREPHRLAGRYLACAAWLFAVFLPLATWQRIVVGTETHIGGLAAMSVAATEPTIAADGEPSAVPS